MTALPNDHRETHAAAGHDVRPGVVAAPPPAGWARRVVRAGELEVLLDGPAAPDEVVRQREIARRGEAERGYWAHLWSSSEVLARHVATSMMIGPGVRVLEIGCGLGLTGVVAAMRGATAVLTDREPDAARAATHNAAINGVSHLVTACAFDWRDEPDPSWQPGVILAADVIYKPGSVEPIAGLIKKLGCVALMSEPNRNQSADAPARMQELGLRVWTSIVRGGRIFTVQAR